MFQIVQTRFKNLAANAKLLNSVWPFFDMKHYYTIKWLPDIDNVQ